MNNEKVFKISQIKGLLNQVLAEKMSFSRFVEILNETANKKTFDINVTTKDELSELIDWMQIEINKEKKDFSDKSCGIYYGIERCILKAKSIKNGHG
jgi:hypothetical protein